MENQPRKFCALCLCQRHEHHPGSLACPDGLGGWMVGTFTLCTHQRWLKVRYLETGLTKAEQHKYEMILQCCASCGERRKHKALKPEYAAEALPAGQHPTA